MENFFLFLELMIPLAGGFLILKKGSLAIVYMPLLFFARTLFEQTKYVPGSLYYYYFTALLIYFAFFNLRFFQRNIFANLLIFYFFILLFFVDDFKSIEWQFLNTLWLFVGISLIPEILKNHTRATVSKEISNMAFLLMSLFVVNVMFSTYYNYNPYAIYGISSGILFGKMSSDIYNIFPFALFVIFRKGVKENNIYFLALYLVSIFLVLLTMRRSVMALSLLGTLLVLVELVKFKELKNLFLYSFIIGLTFLVVISRTTFLDQFVERFEQRGISEKKLEEEGRLMEFGLLYKDFFVYEDYDFLFGFGLFQSHGNYGKKIFGDRSLHTDFAVLMHGSGVIGLILYVLMFGLSFFQIFRNSKSRGDYIQFVFLTICFLVFFINGRFTTVSATLFMLLIFNLPFAKSNPKTYMMDKNALLIK